MTAVPFHVRPVASWWALAALVAAAGVACGREAGREPAPARAAAPLPALARARAEWPGLTIEVVQARRTGGVLLIQMRFANTSQQRFEFGNRFAADPADRDTLADATLLEPSGLRKYFILRDRDNRPACSADITPLQPGEQRLLDVRFPAPPEGTSRITIRLPHVPDIRDVPLQ